MHACCGPFVTMTINKKITRAIQEENDLIILTHIYDESGVWVETIIILYTIQASIQHTLLWGLPPLAARGDATYLWDCASSCDMPLFMVFFLCFSHLFRTSCSKPKKNMYMCMLGIEPPTSPPVFLQLVFTTVLQYIDAVVYIQQQQ